MGWTALSLPFSEDRCDIAAYHPNRFAGSHLLERRPVDGVKLAQRCFEIAGKAEDVKHGVLSGLIETASAPYRRLGFAAEFSALGGSETLKAWMGSTHFLTKTLEKVRTEMSLHVLASNIKRLIQMFGVAPLIDAIRA